LLVRGVPYGSYLTWREFGNAQAADKVEAFDKAIQAVVAENARLREAVGILREGLEHVRDEHLAAQATVDEMQCHWCDTLNLPCWTYMEANGRLIAAAALERESQ
jgi:hypothetical protein